MLNKKYFPKINYSEEAIAENILSMPGVKSGTPVTDKEIAEAEKKLGVSLPKDYIIFLKQYGGLTLNYMEVYGIKGNPSSVNMTLAERKHDETIPKTHIVISDVGNGDIYCLTKKGNIVLRYHETHEEKEFAGSLNSCIKKFLKISS